MNKKDKSWGIIIGLSLSILLINITAFAWTRPSQAPPGGNVSPPLNTSTRPQVKGALGQGSLGIHGMLRAFTNLIVDGRVGIGTTAPTARLDVDGQIRIRGGAPGAGRILTSDATGLATWVAATGVGMPSGTAGQTLRHNGANWIANSNIFNTGTNVGIGTTTPQTRLDVAGAIRVGSQEICNANTAGAIRYISATQRFEGCNGLVWGPMASISSLFAPSSLSATTASATQINLAWTDNSKDETGFQIEKCAGATCTAFALVHTTSANTTTWSNTGLVDGIDYRYRVRAINALDTSTFSNIAKATAHGGFMRIFVTSTTHNGNLGGLSGGDSICASRASEAGLTGTYKAWLSSSTVNALDRIQRRTLPFRRIDGITVAHNWTHLVFEPLLAPINITEKGNPISPIITECPTGRKARTGTSTMGTATSNTCADWSTHSSLGTVGDTDSSTVWSLWCDAPSCIHHLHLYCIQQ